MLQHSAVSALRHCSKAILTVAIWMAIAFPIAGRASIGPSVQKLLLNPQIAAVNGVRLGQIKVDDACVVSWVNHADFVDKTCSMAGMLGCIPLEAIDRTAVDKNGGMGRAIYSGPLLRIINGQIPRLQPLSIWRNHSTPGPTRSPSLTRRGFALFLQEIPYFAEVVLHADEYVSIGERRENRHTTRIFDNDREVQVYASFLDLQAINFDRWRNPWPDGSEHLFLSNVGLPCGLHGLNMGFSNRISAGLKSIPSIRRASECATCDNSREQHASYPIPLFPPAMMVLFGVPAIVYGFVRGRLFLIPVGWICVAVGLAGCIVWMFPLP
jgi:hypothetical protein